MFVVPLSSDHRGFRRYRSLLLLLGVPPSTSESELGRDRELSHVTWHCILRIKIFVKILGQLDPLRKEQRN